MEALVLAGGLGTRLRPVVGDVPKPIAPVAGAPFLQHLLSHWATEGIRRFVLSVGYRSELIRQTLGSRIGNARVDYVTESSPRGTGGAVIDALATMRASGTFLVMNGDTFFNVSLSEMIRVHRTNRADATFAVTPLTEPGRYGNVRFEEGGRVISLDAGGEGEWANGGVFLFERAFLATLPSSTGPRSLEKDYLVPALKEGRRIYALPSSGRFIDIGTPEDFAKAQDMFAAPRRNR